MRELGFADLASCRCNSCEHAELRLAVARCSAKLARPVKRASRSTSAPSRHFFLDHGGPQSDPHGLDAEGDGIACESNPCPCYYGTGSGGGGGHTPPPNPTIKQRAVIVKVVDGDTYDVRLLPRGPKKRVRALGIDTPEV